MQWLGVRSFPRNQVALIELKYNYSLCRFDVLLNCFLTSDMEFLEVLTEGLDRVLMVRGGGREVITIYS